MNHSLVVKLVISSPRVENAPLSSQLTAAPYAPFHPSFVQHHPPEYLQWRIDVWGSDMSGASVCCQQDLMIFITDAILG